MLAKIDDEETESGGPSRIFYSRGLNLNPAVSPLLFFASLPDCSQNQTAVSDTQQSLSYF